MADEIRYQIQPKIVDSDSNETDLDKYTVIQSYTRKVESTDTIANGDIYVSLPTLENQVAVEFQSDQEVYFQILNGGVEVVEILSCKNFFLKASFDWTFKIKNKSGSSANIVWRLFV